MQRLQTFPSREALYAAAAERIAEALRAGVAARGHGGVALSGGTTPEPAYALLPPKPIDWPNTTFALVDERFVAPDHPASNEAMARRALRKPLEKGARFAPMYAPGSPEDAAAQADGVYAALHLDIAVMGMGADGHTASWFPGSEQLADALDAATPRTVIAVRAPQAAGSADRLTLTYAAVARADRVVLLITGADKLAAFRSAAGAAPTVAPVAALLALGEKLEILWAA